MAYRRHLRDNAVPTLHLPLLVRKTFQLLSRPSTYIRICHCHSLCSVHKLYIIYETKTLNRFLRILRTWQILTINMAIKCRKIKFIFDIRLHGMYLYLLHYAIYCLYIANVTVISHGGKHRTVQYLFLLCFKQILFLVSSYWRAIESQKKKLKSVVFHQNCNKC